MRLILLVGLALAIVLALTAYHMADDEHEPRPFDHHGHHGLRPAGNGPARPLPQLIQGLGLPADTRILEIEREYHGGSMVYEIELVDGRGRIYAVYVDPDTGVRIDIDGDSH